MGLKKERELCQEETERVPAVKAPEQAEAWDLAAPGAEIKRPRAQDKVEGRTPVVARVAEAGWGAACAIERVLETAEAETNQRKGFVMPGGNGTGPMGMGPMTGRAAGICAGYQTPGYMNWSGSRGFGMGRGRGGGGRGWRNRFYATGVPGWMQGGWGGALPLDPAPERELSALKQQAEYFGKALEDIRGRIQELESQAKES